MMQYLQPEKAAANLRVLRALTEPLDNVTRRARKLMAMLKKSAPEGMKFSLKQGTSLAGGGALPTGDIPTALLSIRSEILSPNTLEASLRGLEVPVIARIADDEVLFDLRTVDEQELVIIRDAMKTIVSSHLIPNTIGNM